MAPLIPNHTAPYLYSGTTISFINPETNELLKAKVLKAESTNIFLVLADNESQDRFEVPIHEIKAVHKMLIDSKVVNTSNGDYWTETTDTKLRQSLYQKITGNRGFVQADAESDDFISLCLIESNGTRSVSDTELIGYRNDIPIFLFPKDLRQADYKKLPKPCIVFSGTVKAYKALNDREVEIHQHPYAFCDFQLSGKLTDKTKKLHYVC
ncbi:hypothetical protein [Vibrio barjaei]|uniref:hypothetical protein n=1 Tax=Vibrio barjaei TaxID=1676683 RepID=UPI0022840F8F|nr:hypothetical protein [Vibrio barjaei]MCY9874586.1 hypothetical protein [Vibrio barjaei]